MWSTGLKAKASLSPHIVCGPGLGIIYKHETSWIWLIFSKLVFQPLTCHESITQAKFPSRILSFSKFGTFLVRIMVEKVLPIMVDLQPQPRLLQGHLNVMKRISNSGTHRVLPIIKMVSGLILTRDWTHFVAIMPMGFEIRLWKNLTGAIFVYLHFCL